MNSFSYDLSNGHYKEMSFNMNVASDIMKAEKAKARLENKGYNLFKTKSCFDNVTIIYRLDN